MRQAAIAFVALLYAAPAYVVAAPPQPPIEQRLQRAEDDLAIRRVLLDYAWALDHRDIDGYIALFAKNGEWVNGSMVRKAPNEIRSLLVGMFGVPQPGWVNTQSVEITTNPDIQLEGDHATAHCWHLLMRRGADGRPVAALAGRYDDELIREDGKWKFLRRVDNPIMPTPEEWAKVMAAQRRGQ